MLYTDTSNTADTLDSRDVDARIEELQDRIVTCDCGPHAPGVLHYPFCAMLDPDVNIDPLDVDETDELANLLAFREEGRDYSADWDYGVTFIRDSYWEDYARELADDIGAVNADAVWPNSYIDWESAARDLRVDYSCVTFDGTDYWVRS